MMRFCPNCRTERSVGEWFCEGVINEVSCNWELSNLPIRAPGDRPQQIVTVEGDSILPTDSGTPVGLRCVNNHPMSDGDLMCLVCGADQVAPVSSQNGINAANDGQPLDARPSDTSEETQIDGWRLLRRISSSDSVRERYITQHDVTKRQAVLTLYRPGAEPDPTVYDVIGRLPREHVPEIITTGRWDGRAYEVAEELSGGTLADIGIAVSDMEAIRHVVSELGQALHSFSEAGLRHRDLRPSTLLVRSRDPLDLVISGFGSARLAEFDLDIVSPLETTRYMAPEAIAGGVAAASDWWSLGMILLEQLTNGACFEGTNPQAFLIHIVTNGATLPDNLDPQIHLLLRGFLARDRHERWQWQQVQAWLDGKDVQAPNATTSEVDIAEGSSISLGTQRFYKPIIFALKAAEREHWAEAKDHLDRGVLITWAEQAGLASTSLSGLRRLIQQDDIDSDCRLMIALKLLNPELPLILRGEIVNSSWLAHHALEAYDLITGAVPPFLDRMDTERWLSDLRSRVGVVRQRAAGLNIELSDETSRIYLLSTSRAQLAARWEEQRLLLPDSDHPGLLSLSEKRIITEEDLIVLLSASITQFRSVDAILDEAERLAGKEDILAFDRENAKPDLALSRVELFRKIDDRIAGFARTGKKVIDGLAEQFRLERRLPLHEAILLLAIPKNQWLEPQKQQYVSQILGFFEKKISAAVMRGPLVRMTINKSSGRADLMEMNSTRHSGASLLEHILQRNSQSIQLDPALFVDHIGLEWRLNALHRQTSVYKRDTGIDGLYMGFPFLAIKDTRPKVRPRVTPILLWPVKLLMELGTRGQVALAFDGEREEVRINPALEGLLGQEAVKAWRVTADEILGRSSLKITDVIDAFGMLASAEQRQLKMLPAPDYEIPPGTSQLLSSAVFFHVMFSGQAIGEDLRQLKVLSPSGTALESMLRLKERSQFEAPIEQVAEIDRYLTVASDPSQESAVLKARQEPGLLVEGPPGTGKSQTIVNMVADAIGRKKSLLIVCQKHAALEVVYKRLLAEGLGDRIIMVNDVNKDREPTIRAVREQLDSIFKGSLFDNGWARQRERVAAKIEALEGELDRLHRALHSVDQATGLSYRALLGELIQLEAGTPPLSMSQLRSKLSPLDPSALTTVEEQCAPLARYWLPAKFEGSALVELQAFAGDAATIDEFKAAFTSFLEVEKHRVQILNDHPARFDVDDPEPYLVWLKSNSARLAGLDDVQRKRLALWLPLFRPADRVDAPGQIHYTALKAIYQALLSINQAGYDEILSTALAKSTDVGLQTTVVEGTLAIRPPTFFDRLNPATYLRRNRLLKFITDTGAPIVADSLANLLAAARLEQQWRPHRLALNTIADALQLAPVAVTCGPTLIEECLAYLRKLEEVRELAQHLAIAPRGDEFDAAVMTGDRAPVEQLLDGFERAFIRHAARQLSLQALTALHDWFVADLVDRCKQSIQKNLEDRAVLNRIHDALPTLAAYQQFRTRSQNLSKEALDIFAVMRTHESLLGNVPTEKLDEEVRRIINREARLGWKRRMEQDNPELLLEQTETIAKVQSLAVADEEMRRLNRDVLREGIDRNTLASPKQWEDVTRLRGQRSRRLREFIELGSGMGLMSLRPVWLMNPDVASRVLPLKNNLFDSIVYDEASQMPVEYALPTLFRGTLAVVSGDEKQMPPSSFFSGRIESDETELFDGEQPDDDATDQVKEQFEDTWNRREIKDCPDMLQLARTALPVTTLQIHYRSVYRELISYSNAAFYENNLSVPARHPDSTIQETKPIEMIQVNGLYEKQANPQEADRVVDYLAELWKQPYVQRPSVGVVTFNLKQAALIEERLELRAEQDSLFRTAYQEESTRSEEGEDMAVFVKNVENVQGDERDVIIFSTTFGRNGQGTFKRFFGVLGQKGGERRLNVAVTRARQKIVLITSMPIRDISDMLNTQRKPVIPRDYLQGYMEYARTMSNGDLPSARTLLSRMHNERVNNRLQQGQKLDGFARDVHAYLRSLGFDPVVAQEGDAFGMDFAIADPLTGLYAIGIECDAPRHELLMRARARDIWRPSVLRRAIPHLHRISSQAWYHHNLDEKARLKSAIEAALQKEPA